MAKGIGLDRLAMDDECLSRCALELPQPAQQLLAVSVRREHVQADDLGMHRDILSMDLELARAALERTRQLVYERVAGAATQAGGTN